ncbi:hypothetical protein ARMGADRAFT_55020 [Armillaria gallica]|uniref:Uncharacterized protein n=1 Tax=Armillaria gallica TaxID=47427 RepID=A0A2H3EPS3_ARMGA|nr:hypothetical protein ARMGADRAFT_55020 [Armillaria gallica]
MEWNGALKSSSQFSYIKSLAKMRGKEKVCDINVIVLPYYIQFERDTIEISSLHYALSPSSAIAANSATMCTFPKQEYHGTSSVCATIRSSLIQY